MQFKINKFLQLLEQKQKFLSTNQSLKEFSVLQKQEDDQLVIYESLLKENIFWQSRNDYIQILDDFVQNKIVFDEFAKNISVLKSSNLKSYRKLIIHLEEIVLTDFEFNDIIIDYDMKSRGFGELISDLSSSIDICEPTISLEENLQFPERIVSGMSEKFFKIDIEGFFLPKMKKY